MNKKIVVLMMCLLTISGFVVESKAQLSRVSGISIVEDGAVTKVIIQRDEETQYRYFTLAGDQKGIVERIVIDITGARHAIRQQFEAKGPIAGIRSSQFLEHPPIVRITTLLRVPATLRVDTENGNIVLTLSNYTFVEPSPPLVVQQPEPIQSFQVEQKKDSVRINITDVTLGAVIQLFQIEHGMNILVSKSVDRTERLAIFLTGKFEKEKLFESILAANEYKYYKPQEGLYVVLGKDVTVDEEMQVEIFKLNYIAANDIIANLQNVKSQNGNIEVVSRSSMGSAGITILTGGGGGGAAGGAAGGGGGNPLQGIDAIVGEQEAAARISDVIFVVERPVIIERMRKIISTLDVPVPQVHISVKVVETRLAESEKWGLNWQTMMEGVGIGGEPTGSGGAQGGAAAATAGGAGGAAGAIQVPGLPLKIGDFRAGTLTLAQTSVMLSLLERREDSKLLNQPSITTMHNQQVTIAIGTSIPIEVTQIGGGAITTIQNQNIVVALTVIPRVNENKYITLWVKTVIQEVIGFTGRNSDQPIISSRTATTQVRVRSGEVVIIGGLIKEDKIKVVSKVKFFGSLPLIGKLFTHNRVDVKRSELIIFITPDIVNLDMKGTGDTGKSDNNN